MRFPGFESARNLPWDRLDRGLDPFLRRALSGVKVVDDKMVSFKPVALFRAEKTLIRILHVNDFHGFAEPHKPFCSQVMFGGAAYLAPEVNRLRKSRWCGASFPFKPHLPIATYK